MNSVGQHVFAQLLKVLPMDTFEAIAAKYPLKPCNSRKFTPRDYFTAMLFGQLSGASSLREVVLGMAIAGEKIVHTGAKSMKRTTLAYNNNNSNQLIFKDFYFAVLEQFRCELGHKKQAQFDKPLFSLDTPQQSASAASFMAGRTFGGTRRESKSIPDCPMSWDYPKSLLLRWPRKRTSGAPKPSSSNCLRRPLS